MTDYSKFTIPKILIPDNETYEDSTVEENSSTDLIEKDIGSKEQILLDLSKTREELTFESRSEGIVMSFATRNFNVQELLEMALNARERILQTKNNKEIKGVG